MERASSGKPGLDHVLDELRFGDNVVWQVDAVEDYRHYCRAFAEEALRSGKRLVYLRFGQHPALIEPRQGLQEYNPDPSRGFEHFSMAIREIAAREGVGVYYIFDCLSELLSEWSTDLMMGNFFVVTCPYLFELRTIAYFAVLRGRHSHQTIARIRDTTQLFLDVYHRKDSYYVHPLKVWQRYSPTMFLPHVERGDNLLPLTNSADAARLLAVYPRRGPVDAERRLDHWEQIFMRAAELPEGERAHLRERLLGMLISRDENILALARRFLTIDDLLQIKARLIGSGFIGGKAVGLLLARAILRADERFNWAEALEPHDSFYIGSDAYYTFLVENGCWQWRLEQKKEQNYFDLARLLREKISVGSFPGAIRDQFLEMLGYFGQAPIIVRSSSLLEDGFGNAFAGKYESVFCPNQGDLNERYDRFVQAVRRVYASTMAEEALHYRRQRGLMESDEQMALLVQRVSGSHQQSYFFPDLAGVALSHNLYLWREDMDPNAGMLRLVLGLGTRAVDRTGDDYARFVPLDNPLRRPEGSTDEKRAYTQHGADLLDIERNELATVPIRELAAAGLIQHLPLLVAYDQADQAGPDGPQWYLSFDGLLRHTAFASTMREMLQTLAAAYGYPVDTEFTANFRSDGSLCVNLLQCRPLQIQCNQKRVEVPEQIPAALVILSSRGGFMGGGLELDVARIIVVVPEEYAALPLSEKYQVARLIGLLNGLTASPEDTPTLLLGPGRWGTSTPSLGIPVSFAEICRFTVLGELAFATGGYIPELSYGTHFFQDLVETGLAYLAIDENDPGTYLNREFFAGAPNALTALLPDAERWRDTIRVVNAQDLGREIRLHADPVQQRVLCWQR